MPAPRPGDLFELYAAFTVVGTVVPLRHIVPWIAANGIDLPRFVAEVMATPVSRFFGWDVVIAAFVVVALIVVEGARVRVPGRWVAVAATLCIGVSCGLPLFLALRERALARV